VISSRSVGRFFVLNTKQGLNADIAFARRSRQLLRPTTCCSPPSLFRKGFFLRRPDGAMYPEGYAWHTDAGTEAYKPDGDTEGRPRRC